MPGCAADKEHPTEKNTVLRITSAQGTTMGSEESKPAPQPSPPVYRPPKPEFVTVLGKKQAKAGEDVTFRCEANTDDLSVTWEKKGQRLCCVEGKHRAGKNGRNISLEIKNVDLGDEGNYTVTINNSSGSASCSAMLIVEIPEWRTVQWEHETMVSTLKSFKISGENVRELRFLLHGPVGAGKSSIINTIKSIFEGHQFINCLTASDLTGESFTTKYEKYNVGNVPFTFYDVMGLEKGQSKGVHTNDVISALKGHISKDYTFKPLDPIDEANRYYIPNPTLNDQIHCLVSVIPADKISMMDDEVIQKMKEIRAAASKLGIPQVVFMTRVDKVCEMTEKDITKLYQSRKIKEKMMECSNRVGVTMNCIFPVKNYSEETKANEKLNCLMLEALTQIVHSANDFVKKNSNQLKKE
ncbi:interferon-induced protein 44-like [Astyanax mexicanus]|uniref:Interferon-induced protein 44-like n=1 Tax=Astyanax mexicanus TaxID=7994 RepID=A0A8T2LK54_ASTMX|nr:interferon-induced protein 44-like [Astyanax mexicanus]